MRRDEIKKILMLNLPYSGHVNPTLGLARELVKRKYDLAYINAPKWGETIKNTGAKFIPYANYPTKEMSVERESFLCYRAAYDTALSLKGEYDLLIYENWFFLGNVLSSHMKIPAIKIFSNPAINMNYIRSEILGKSPLWFHMRYRLIRKVISKMSAKGIPYQHEDMFAEMAKTVEAVNIVYTVKEFQAFAEDFGDNFYFVGPSIRDSESNALSLPAVMKPPIIYVSFGTIIKDLAFYKKCIQAFANKNITVIMSTGNRMTREEFGELPENIFIYSYLPQCRVLEKVDLFITHGGQNSVNEAMYYGVPMLVLPHGFDCVSNADMIEKLHLGKKLQNRRIKPEELYTLVTNILDSDEIRKGTETMKYIMKLYNADIMAADITEDYIKQLNSRMGDLV